MTGSTKPVDNALNPAWRDSIVHIITSQSWNDSLPEQTAHETIRKMTHGKGYALRQLAPDTGAYYNEVCIILYLLLHCSGTFSQETWQANPYEPDWQWSFWGPHYARLHAIKQKYDPNGLLWCRHCVGSESWSEQENGALCRAF